MEYRIKSFTFYDTYYELIDNVPTNDKRLLLEAIFDYMFKGIDPNLEGLNKAIFNNLKRPLDVSRKQSERKTKKEPNKNQIKTELKPKQNTSMMSMSMSMSNIYNNIYFNNKELNSIFIDFLEMRKKLKAVNSDRAINALINKLNNYDDETKYKMIEQSIENSWKGLFELKKSYQPKKIIVDEPTWLNQDIQPDIATLEEVEEFEKRLASYCE